MRINSSNIGMESARSYSKTSMDAYIITAAPGKGRSFEIKGKDNDAEKDEKGVDNESGLHMGENSQDIRKQFEALKPHRVSHIRRAGQRQMQGKIMRECINYLLEVFFGRDHVKSSSEYLADLPSRMSQGNGALYHKENLLHFYEEKETTTFETQGTVITEDGREITFGISAQMSRSFTEMSGRIVDNANLCDPLVINLDGNVAEVSDQKFMFDIDGDGIEDKISRLIEGSGFLALDKNDDGEINDGSELFGTKSGNGFADLSEYDQDKNGWIDEDDEIFNKLKIWSIKPDGSKSLIDLKEAGIGALYLGSAPTEFSINDLETNETNAVVRRTGMFLFEDGSAGTMQQVDMATA